MMQASRTPATARELEIAATSKLVEAGRRLEPPA
jgi:hypothetical protein